MTQHTYDNESVQELLNWAKKMLEVQIQTVPQSKLLICIMRKLRLITKEHTKVFSKMLETKNYPTEKYELNKCTTIINGKTYLESLVAMIGNKRPTFATANEEISTLSSVGRATDS